MDSNTNARKPVNNLTQLRHYLNNGGLLRVLQHTNYPYLAGVILQAKNVRHTHAYFCVPDQPQHKVSLLNQGRGLRMLFGYATEYEISETHGKRLFERYGHKQPGVFEFEIIGTHCPTGEKNKELLRFSK